MSGAGAGGEGAAGSAGSAGSGGMAMAGAGNAGSGGALPIDRCSAPTLRQCDGSPFFYHDPATQECMPSGSSQCPSTFENTFSTLAECLATCPGARPALAACDVAADCRITITACCPCDPLPSDQIVAHNVRRTDSVVPLCPEIPCPTCDTPEHQTSSQYYIPGCFSGFCSKVDLRQTQYTECEKDEDCRLRDGAGCCQECSDRGFIAVSSTDFISEFCEADVGCPECDPTVPSGIEAVCDTAVSTPGRCVVAQVIEDGSAGAAGSPEARR
ncbi:MAG TPA: hypothetical protein VGK73_14645 [Polyangiaceae bacterium]